MVAMLLLHVGVALQAGVVLPVKFSMHQQHRAGPAWSMVAVVGPAAQRRCSSRLLSSGSAPLQHAHRGSRSLISLGWTANLLDA